MGFWAHPGSHRELGEGCQRHVAAQIEQRNNRTWLGGKILTRARQFVKLAPSFPLSSRLLAACLPAREGAPARATQRQIQDCRFGKERGCASWAPVPRPRAILPCPSLPPPTLRAFTHSGVAFWPASPDPSHVNVPTCHEQTSDCQTVPAVAQSITWSTVDITVVVDWSRAARIGSMGQSRLDPPPQGSWVQRLGGRDGALFPNAVGSSSRPCSDAAKHAISPSGILLETQVGRAMGRLADKPVPKRKVTGTPDHMPWHRVVRR